jgi:glycosyltransferase involved in cell wall biosynthesis
MISVRQIGQIQRPTAWVLHDTWTFCGAEHYPHGNEDRRFVDGYRRDNRLAGEWGIDLNRHVWERKRRYWTRPIQLIAPSNWMAQQASQSALARDWPVTVIPNPLDTSWWGALGRSEARLRLGLRQDATILLHGAIGGDKDRRKGADLLFAALGKVPVDHGVRRDSGTLQVLTFGGKPGTRKVGSHVVRSVGRLDDEGLRAHYSAADVMVVPSRMDNLPQTAVESITCGTPVVAFRTGGLTDIVDDGVNGRLAEPFSVESLAESISWVLASPERHQALSESARASSSRWEPGLIAKRYVELFEEMLSREPWSD